MSELCYETINRSPFITPGFEADLPAQMRAAGAAGFRWTGIDLPSIEQFCEQGGTLLELGALLEETGIRCFELQPLIITANREETEAGARRIVEIAQILAPPWIQCGVVGEITPEVEAGLRACETILAEVDARLAIEYLPFNSIRSIDDTRRFIASAGAPSAGIVVDTWHFFHGPEDWSALESLSLDELAYPQFDDAPPLEGEDLMFETTQRRVMPGEGRFELDRFASILLDKGYADPVSVEILSAEWRDRAPADFARAVHESTAKYWQPDVA